MVTYRTVILFILLLFGIAVIGFDYINTEFIINKGPDDYMVYSHVAAYLRWKYGEPNKDAMRIQIVGFKPDQPKAKKGLYTVLCTYKGRDVTVQAHYEGGEYDDWTDFPSKPN